jgi:Lipocalin-like domain
MQQSAGMTAMIDRLLGTWTLVSAVREEIPSGSKTDMFGQNPHGFINYSPDGRMIALITRRDRKAAANGRPTPTEAEALFRSMLSYAGSFTVEGDVVTHHVDISWNQSFTGGTQKRHFKLDGDRLILSTPQSHDPIDGKLSVRHMTWQRVG